MNLSLIISRLAPARTSERTIGVGVLKNPDPAESDKVLYLIDIPLPTVIGDRVEKTIIDSLQTFFTEANDHSVYRFEETIKQANTALLKLAETENDEWVGHINAILALWDNNELFVTHAGRMLGAVARNGTLVFIIDPQQTDKKIQIHKTFANLTSGQLNNGDTIIFGNGEVGRHFSPQFLVNGSMGKNPGQLTQLIQQASKRLNLRYVGAITARISDNDSDDELADQPVAFIEENEHSPLATLPEVNQRIRVLGKSVNEQIKNLPWDDWKNKAISGLKIITDSAAKYIKKGLKIIKGSEPPKIEFEEDYSPEPQATDPSVQKPLYVHSRQHKIRAKFSRIYKNWLLKFKGLKHFLRRVNPKHILALGITLILIVLISAIAEIRNHANQTSSSKTMITRQINQADKLIKQAQGLINSNQPDQARTDLGKARTLINQANQNNSGSSLIASAQNQLNSLLDPLNAIDPIDTSSSESVPSDTIGIEVIGQYIFSYQANSGKIYRQTIGQSGSGQVIYSTDDGAAIVDMISLLNSQQLIIATNKNHLYRVYVNGITNADQLIPPSGQSWAPVQAMTTYLSNIYILEKGTGQIWRYISSDSVHYTERQPYLSSSSLASQTSVDITTDGEIYVLDKSGVVSKFERGNLQNFGPMLIPLPDSSFNNPQHILTDINSNSVWVQDNTRLIEFSKTGQYIRQFTLSSGRLSACSLSYETKQAWVLNGTQLYLIPL